MTVLGISPGTRSVGIALIKNKELVDWRIKGFSGSWSDKKLKDIGNSITEILVKEKVNKVGIKLTPKERSSKMLSCVECELIEIATESKLNLKTFTIKDIKRCCEESSNKYRLAEHLTKKYPFLITELKKFKSSNEVYYHRLFEAVAIAHIHQ